MGKDIKAFVMVVAIYLIMYAVAIVAEHIALEIL